jgi:hypothetical protein
MSQERIAPVSRMSQSGNYGNCGALARSAAEMDRGSRELRILGRPMDGNFGREGPVLHRRIWRLTRRPSASAKAADKFVRHSPDRGRDGIFRLGKHYGTR